MELQLVTHCHSIGKILWYTYLLIYSMEQSPLEANRFAASQEISRISYGTYYKN
jgi:hypothetical protein